MVKARVRHMARVGYMVECQRAKYKHWHLIGTHRETDIEQCLYYLMSLWMPT